jgi:hypothetical protein
MALAAEDTNFQDHTNIVIDVIIPVLNLKRGPEYHSSSWQIFKNTICFCVRHFAFHF